MAKFLSYRSVKDLFDGKKSEAHVKKGIIRVPPFILERCKLLNFDLDHPKFKETIREVPLFLDFVLSRYIQHYRARDMIIYFIPKTGFDFWTEYSVYYSEIFPYRFLSTIFVQANGLHEFYFTKNGESDVYNLYFEDLGDLKLGLDRFCPTDIYRFIYRRAHLQDRRQTVCNTQKV